MPLLKQVSGDLASSYQKDFNRLAALIVEIKVAMLTSCEADGSLRSRPMGTQSVDDFDGTLYFFTDKDSHKALEVENCSAVNVAYAQPGSKKFISLSGTARMTQDAEMLAAHWTPSMKAWFPKGLGDPQLALLIVEVNYAEFWESPSKPALMMAIAEAAITGERLSPGQDKQLNLKRGASRNALHH